MEHTPAPQQRSGRAHQATLARLIAVIVALALLGAACASDRADTAMDASSDSGSADAESSFSGSDDASVDIDDTTDAADDAMEDVDAMEDEAMAEATDADADFAGDAETASRATPEAEDASADEATEGGGLFGTVDADDDVEIVEEPQPVDQRFTDYGIRTFVRTSRDPLSTFALDVDTGSYTIARRYFDDGSRPPQESVRVEEYVNAFDYDYDVPRNGLDVQVDGGPSPFHEDGWLIRVGVQAVEVDDDERLPVSLTFVVDTSGSMNTEDRLGLVKESLSLLVDELDRDDTVAIVTYSGSSGVVLEPTSVRNREEILDAIDGMESGGSTNLQAGLDTGYDMAREAFREDGLNRVIVASDGLANAGITDVDRLVERIRRDADAGVGLVTVGYGLSGYNDTTMEQLADNGDGFYAYVDTIDEAERLFSDELTSTLVTAAIDGKIQVEFDPDVVDEYRLIGYENRGVLDQDFRNDEVDAGELGAGHQATALYEVFFDRDVDIDDRAELGVVRLRWEDPASGDVDEIDEDIDMRDLDAGWTDTATDFRQAVVVATFAEILRDNPYADDVDLEALLEEVDDLARDIDTDEFDEFADLVAQAF